jgi:hypothetical protein
MTKPKTRKQMAEEYGICVKTFMKKCLEVGIILAPRELIYPNEQALIYERLGRV